MVYSSNFKIVTDWSWKLYIMKYISQNFKNFCKLWLCNTGIHDKENFQNNPRCKLLNPAKSEFGIISKHYTEKINKNIRKTTNMIEPMAKHTSSNYMVQIHWE